MSSVRSTHQCCSPVSINRALREALARDAAGQAPDPAPAARREFSDALAVLLRRAQATGAVRPDVGVAEVHALVAACASMAQPGWEDGGSGSGGRRVEGRRGPDLEASGSEPKKSGSGAAGALEGPQVGRPRLAEPDWAAHRRCPKVPRSSGAPRRGGTGDRRHHGAPRPPPRWPGERVQARHTGTTPAPACVEASATGTATGDGDSPTWITESSRRRAWSWFSP
ncbi:SbtR family transcriptional regulator [Lipingzhangella halophila]|uniref:SbtR family transcriptional regulator n=1 Tax=Lipingzhangella halophila TaxID=1783352 RepID=UPI0035E4657F